MTAGAVALVAVIGFIGAALSLDEDVTTPPPAVEPRLPKSIGDLPVGAPPLAPYVHDDTLYLDGTAFETPYPVGCMGVAGDTVLVGANDCNARFALIREHRFKRLPRSPEAGFPELTDDGRIAYWTIGDDNPTRFVAWDTETHRALASRDLWTQSTPPHIDHVHYLAGIDAEGMGYWVEEGSDVVVTRWDVRADTVEPMPDMTSDEVAAHFASKDPPLFVSPDRTRKAFTGYAPGDSPLDCCTTLLRIRPLGPPDSYGPSEVVRLLLPEGIPGVPLWKPDAELESVFLDVWWETDEALLLVAEEDAGSGRRASHLLRCSAIDGACERVFHLGNANTWRRSWGISGQP